MIYVTGDTHGDFSRFKDPQMKKLKKNDILIICGDFGFIWDGTRKEKSVLKKIADLGYTVAFIDGCHENFDLLESFPVTGWNGGKARVIAPNLVHLMRGQIYTINGKKIFTFGGGHSQDIEFRRDGKWWKREQPSHDEIMQAIDNLESYGNAVDYVITHEPPATVKDCLGVDVFQRLEVHALFEEITASCRYEKWFFGKCHIDKHIPMKFYGVFNKIMPLK
ncbi:MAG: metallophosphoesterase [Ruminococcus sp.]|nr:metallophosphoesterase [Ruminococcus sp.]